MRRISAAALVVVSLLTPLSLGAATGTTGFTVDGESTRVQTVVDELKALAANRALDVVTTQRDGERVPTAEVSATVVTSLIYDAVVRRELDRRGLKVAASRLARARRLERATFGERVWKQFAESFRERQARRRARMLVLAADEGIDLAEGRAARRQLADLVNRLARKASVTISPRFGTWDPGVGVVVPPTDGGPPA